MKPSRPRIFIVGKVAKQTQALKQKVLGESPPKERAVSKRRRLFQEVAARVSSKEKKEKYQYQIADHIHAESLGSILNCDLMGNGPVQKIKTKKQENYQVKPQPHPQISIPAETNQLKEDKAEIAIPLLANHEQPHQNAHNQTFTSSRVKIFNGISLGSFRSNGQLSSLSNLKRRNIFIRHESQLTPLSLNTSLSKERRRIFSNDHRTSILHALQPIVPEEHRMPPLQQTIKEEEQASKITSVVHESVMQSRLPPPKQGIL